LLDQGSVTRVFLCVAVVKATFGFCWRISTFGFSVESDLQSTIYN